MAIGPGRYDEQCTRVRKETGADMVALILVKRGEKPGFSVQGNPLIVLQMLPDMMEFMAKEIRKDLSKDIVSVVEEQMNEMEGPSQ